MQFDIRSRLRETRNALTGDDRGAILAAVAGGWFLSLGTRLAIPAVLPFVRAEFAIDNTTAGALITALWLAYALTQFPSGLLTDTFAERRVLTAAVSIGGVSVLSIALAQNLKSFLAGTVLFGLGTGLYATPRVTLISRIYPERNTTALGIVFASGNVGSVVLPVAGGTIAAIVGWRLGFTLLVPAFALSAAAIWTHLDEDRHGANGYGQERSERGKRKPDGEADASEPGPLGPGGRLRRLSGVLRRPVLLATSTLMLFALAYQGFVGFLAVYLVDVKGFTPQGASLIYGGFFIVGLIGQLIGSDVADDHGCKPTLVGVLCATLLGLLVLPLASNRFVVAALVGVMGVQLTFWPLANSYVYDALPAEIEGGGYGLVRTVYLFVGASGPLIVGRFFDAGAYSGAIWLLGGLVFVVLLLCAVYPDLG